MSLFSEMAETKLVVAQTWSDKSRQIFLETPHFNVKTGFIFNPGRQSLAFNSVSLIHIWTFGSFKIQITTPY